MRVGIVQKTQTNTYSLKNNKNYSKSPSNVSFSAIKFETGDKFSTWFVTQVKTHINEVDAGLQAHMSRFNEIIKKEYPVTRFFSSKPDRDIAQRRADYKRVEQLLKNRISHNEVEDTLLDCEGWGLHGAFSSPKDMENRAPKVLDEIHWKKRDAEEWESEPYNAAEWEAEHPDGV